MLKTLIKIIKNDMIINTVILSAFFSLTLFFFGPAQIYFNNAEEFSSTFLIIFPFLLLGSLLIASFIFVVLYLLRDTKIYQKTVVIIFAVSILFWFQGNILVWRYGIFDGTDIRWNNHIYKGIIDSVIWICFIVFSVYKSSIIFKYVKKVSSFLILMQIIFIIFVVIKAPPSPSFKTYSLDDSNKFSFSKEKNVIILVLDAFQSDIFKEIVEENINYKNIFDGFSYFPDAISPYPKTKASITAFMTGVAYNGKNSIQEYVQKEFSRNSIGKVLLENNYNVDMFPYGRATILWDKRVMSNIRKKKLTEIADDLSFLVDVSMFRCFPHFCKILIYNNQNWFLQEMLLKIKETGSYSEKKKIIKVVTENRDNTITSVRKKDKIKKNKKIVLSKVALSKLKDVRFISDMLKKADGNNPKNVFKFYHLKGPHRPLRMDENLEPKIMEYNKSNYKKQALGTLKITKMFFNKLKQLDVYDNSLIFIIADHGSGCSDETLVNVSKKYSDLKVGSLSFQQIKAKALPIVLVKGINVKGKLKTKLSPVALYDIPKTIASELNIDASFPGKSMLKIGENGKRNRYFYFDKTEFSITGHSWDDGSWRRINDH